MRSAVEASFLPVRRRTADPLSGPQVGALADGSVLIVGQVTTNEGPTVGIVTVGPAVAWAAERPGIPTGLSISEDAAQTIAISSTTAKGGMTVDFYSTAQVPKQARRQSVRDRSN
jgi:hypothetical protein